MCHTDAADTGGLSLEHYDSAKPDPALAAMILSTLNNGAMGAAGNGVPDKTTNMLGLSRPESRLSAQRTKGGVVSASIVCDVPPGKPESTDAPVYRVTIFCNPSTGGGEMKLTWSPQPQTGHAVTASADGKAPVEYQIEGKESRETVQQCRAGTHRLFRAAATTGDFLWLVSPSPFATCFRARL